MRTLVSKLFASTTIAVLLLLSPPSPVTAQSSSRHFEVEVEPVAYLLDGAGIHVGYQAGSWNYVLEAFGLEVPEALHGNNGFKAALLGAELHVEHLFGDERGGFYVGPEVGINRFEVTRTTSGKSKRRLRYAVGLRGGYRWYPGLGDLYLSPVAGLTYTLNTEPVKIEGKTFETGPVTPFVTVGLGWSF